MKRALLTTLCTLLLACLTAPTASATSVHNKKGPICTDQGLTAKCTGTLAGLGNFDILVRLTTSGTGTTQCENPGNGNLVPGQNPGLTIPSISGIQVIPGTNVKNGNASYTVVTTVPADPTADQAGCPNDNWTASWADISFAGISTTGTSTLSVFQCIGGTYSTEGVCSAGGPQGNDGTLVLTTTIP